MNCRHGDEGAPFRTVSSWRSSWCYARLWTGKGESSSCVNEKKLASLREILRSDSVFQDTKKDTGDFILLQKCMWMSLWIHNGSCRSHRQRTWHEQIQNTISDVGSLNQSTFLLEVGFKFDTLMLQPKSIKFKNIRKHPHQRDRESCFSYKSS